MHRIRCNPTYLPTFLSSISNQPPLMSSPTNNPREGAMSCVFGPSIWAPHWREMRLRDGWVGSG
ncbi:hypothetical protein JMJ77_0009149 [Colletotrichum scovillei]|uniref:Uncharacterized protein n=1 Tax=Colletotrichum scovillei TaxID=1209932 RepID=A0A9P7QZZ0_9PEZI|nr:hypothetical protein JMJ77_0009149 [Colletotrichum scovillei]KAG7052224.1 hypothetical protein JMJ78_0005245 [Colletotrichum scovillei]KAG7064515.1 hypothetical protein JMJ76_0012278 [Colletotrichum scovillei]